MGNSIIICNGEQHHSLKECLDEELFFLWGFALWHLMVKCLNSTVIDRTILLLLCSVYMLGLYKGSDWRHSNGRERGLLVILCQTGVAESCWLKEKSTITRNRAGRFRNKTGVSGARNNASICCCWLCWNQSLESGNCLYIHTVNRERLAYKTLLILILSNLVSVR